MRLYQLLGILLFSTLLTAPAVAQANPINIQMEGLSLQISHDQGVSLHSRSLGLEVNRTLLRESIYQRVSLEPDLPRLTCRSSNYRTHNTYTGRIGDSYTYTQNSTTTQLCQ